MKQRWKIITGISAGLIIMLITVWISPVGRFIQAGGLSMEEQPFDSVQWKAVTHEPADKMRIRLLMLDDLMDTRLKTGTDSATVKAMLGEPDRIYGFSYGLGTLTPGMDPLFMVLTFGPTGKVEKIDIETRDKLDARNNPKK